MNRRHVLKAITGLTAAAGVEMSPTYITAHDAAGVDVVVLKIPGALSDEQAKRLKETWEYCVKGTVLEKARAVFLTHGMSLELVRTREP